jgi:hypothetical protein
MCMCMCLSYISPISPLIAAKARVDTPFDAAEQRALVRHWLGLGLGLGSG